MTASSRWPWLIILLMTGFVLFSAWSFYRAAKESSAVTDRDYYSHGLRYNQTLLERQAGATLGWQVLARMEGRSVTVLLRDRDQQVVAGASGTLNLVGAGNRPARDLPLREVEPGNYQADLPGDLRGEQTVEVIFQRDGARLSQRFLIAVR